MLAAAAAIAVVAGAAVGVTALLSDDDQLRAVTPATAPTAAELTAEIAVSTTTVRYGEPVTVRYSWSDGDGQLLNVNTIGDGAVHYVRSIPCEGDANVPQPSSDKGSWTYVPGPATFGPPPRHPANVEIGVEVQTAGCARQESRLVTRTVTVLPPG